MTGFPRSRRLDGRVVYERGSQARFLSQEMQDWLKGGSAAEPFPASVPEIPKL
jgi:hypothetical protein